MDGAGAFLYEHSPIKLSGAILFDKNKFRHDGDYVKADIKRADISIRVVTLFGLVKGLFAAPNKYQDGCLMQSG